MKHSYDAAEKAARLSVYADALKDNIKQYGDTTTARERAALLTLNTARELKALDRIILGTDGPASNDDQAG